MLILNASPHSNGDTAYIIEKLRERIKVIRVSERMAYQKITDIFIATSTDYNPKSEEAYTFFKIVQNKLHLYLDILQPNLFMLEQIQIKNIWD